MGVEEKIKEYLSHGYTPQQIIEKGFKKSTVYKVANPVKRESVVRPYFVVELKQAGGDVLMGLSNITTISQEEMKRIEKSSAEAEIAEKINAEKIVRTDDSALSDEERTIKRTSEALKKYMPQLFGASTGGGGTASPMTMTFGFPSAIFPTRFMIEIPVSREQYVKMGKPAIGDIVKLSFSLEAT